MKAKKEAIKAAPQGINSDWQTLLNKTEDRHNEMLDAIDTKFAVACWKVECSPTKEKLSALEKDFKETVKRY